MDGIGQRVQARIQALGTNSAEVARRAGLERTFVHDLISGRKKSVTAEALISLAIALQCLPEDLVGRHGVIARGTKATVAIAGLVEPGVWRTGISPPLGSFTLAEEDPDGTLPYLIKSSDAASFGIASGSVIAVDPAGDAKAGDIVLIERTRDDLVELSVRKYTPLGDGKVALLSPTQQENPPLLIPSERPGEKVRIIGKIRRAITLFPNSVA